VAEQVRTPHDRWDVVLTVPDEIGTLGLHDDEADALSAFRAAVGAAVGNDLSAHAREALDEAFLAARNGASDQGVLWSGFIAAAVPDVDGPDGTRPVVVLLEIRLAPLREFPAGSPLNPAAVLARGLKQLYGDEARTHLVTYDGDPAVAVVRAQEMATAGMTIGGASVPEGAPAAELLRAEVHRLFPTDGALVAVLATTWLPECLDDAVVIAGTLARGIRLRDTTRPMMAVRLEDGDALGRGLTLLGRRPEADDVSGPVHAVRDLQDRTVSRNHCVVELRADTVRVRDLGSSNGTVVERPDGERVACAPGALVEVPAGSRVLLGEEVLVVRRDETSPAPDPETPPGGK